MKTDKTSRAATKPRSLVIKFIKAKGRSIPSLKAIMKEPAVIKAAKDAVLPLKPFARLVALQMLVKKVAEQKEPAWIQSDEGKAMDDYENRQKRSSELRLPRSAKLVVEIKGGGRLYIDNMRGLWLEDPARGTGFFKVRLFDSLQWFQGTALRAFRIAGQEAWSSWLSQIAMTLALGSKRKHGTNPHVARN